MRVRKFKNKNYKLKEKQYMYKVWRALNWPNSLYNLNTIKIDEIERHLNYILDNNLSGEHTEDIFKINKILNNA